MRNLVLPGPRRPGTPGVIWAVYKIRCLTTGEFNATGGLAVSVLFQQCTQDLIRSLRLFLGCLNPLAFP